MSQKIDNMEVFLNHRSDFHPAFVYLRFSKISFIFIYAPLVILAAHGQANPSGSSGSFADDFLMMTSSTTVARTADITSESWIVLESAEVNCPFNPGQEVPTSRELIVGTAIDEERKWIKWSLVEELWKIHQISIPSWERILWEMTLERNDYNEMRNNLTTYQLEDSPPF